MARLRECLQFGESGHDTSAQNQKRKITKHITRKDIASQLLESKIGQMCVKLDGCISQYKEQQTIEEHAHNKTLQHLRDLDERYFDTFQKQIRDREAGLARLRGRVSELKPKRNAQEEESHVLIETNLIASYKRIEKEDAQRKETTD
eukprot:474218_1